MHRLDLDYRKGRLWSVSVTLLDSTVTQADLEARFGVGEPTPVLHTFHEYRLAYPTVVVPGAAATCAVFADLERDPGPAAVAHGVLLRRDGVTFSGTAPLR